jgi:hypothetical protein
MRAEYVYELLASSKQKWVERGGNSGGIEILSREIGASEKRHELIDVG